MSEMKEQPAPAPASQDPRTHALKTTVSLLRATLDATTDGILVVDREGRIVSFNSRFQEMWRIPDPIIESRKDDQALAFVLDQLADPEAFLAKVRELYGSPEATSFDILTFKDERVFERYSMPQRVGGECVGRVWSFRDVTKRRRTEDALRRSEEQLRQSRKMEAIGRLAGGVAHDFNNLLMVIKGYCQITLEQMESDDRFRRNTEEISRAAERAAALTQQLLAFSRRQILRPRVMNLNTEVTEMERMLRRVIGEDIDLTVFLAPDLGNVRADPSQIEQVILNLAVNARDAMPQGGRLSLETRNVDLDNLYAASHVGVTPGPYVLLAVSDNGCGIDEATKAQIFDPFFTTKEQGKGTGLGLSTVYGIVKQSGGNIWVYSEPGRGATFKVYLPRVEAPAEHRPRRPAVASVSGGTETILLAEDEEMVRHLVRRVLEDHGYRVIEAPGATQALQEAHTHQGPIHLLLTDVVMPQMSGPELAMFLGKFRPETKILFMSGYTDDAVMQHGVLEPGSAFLQKPVSPDALLSKVREVLDAGSVEDTLS